MRKAPVSQPSLSHGFFGFGWRNRTAVAHDQHVKLFRCKAFSNIVPSLLPIATTASIVTNASALSCCPSILWRSYHVYNCTRLFIMYGRKVLLHRIAIAKTSPLKWVLSPSGLAWGVALFPRTGETRNPDEIRPVKQVSPGVPRS